MLPNETMEHSAYKPSFSGLLTTSIIATLYVGEVANVEVISLSVLEHIASSIGGHDRLQL